MANRNRPTTCRSRRLTGRMRACSPPAWPRVPTTRYRAPWPTQRKRTALPWAWSRTRCLAGTRRQRTHRRRPLPPRQPSPGGGTGPLLAGPGRAPDALERQGKTVIALCDPQRVRASSPSPTGSSDSSREAIRELHALDVKTLMLTGDNPHTAAAIAAQVGIDAARGNLPPEDKLREVEARQADGSRVGMVGDGSTTRWPWPAPTSASPWARRAPTRPSRPPASR